MLIPIIRWIIKIRNSKFFKKNENICKTDYNHNNWTAVNTARSFLYKFNGATIKEENMITYNTAILTVDIGQWNLAVLVL